MLKRVWGKLLLANIVVATISVAGILLHVTGTAPVMMKLLFYPMYGYTLFSFVVSAIAIVYAAIDYQRGDRSAKLGIYAHIGYIFALIAGVVLVVAWL